MRSGGWLRVEKGVGRGDAEKYEEEFGKVRGVVGRREGHGARGKNETIQAGCRRHYGRPRRTQSHNDARKGIFVASYTTKASVGWKTIRTK